MKLKTTLLNKSNDILERELALDQSETVLNSILFLKV